MADLSLYYEAITQALGLSFANALWDKECTAWGLEAEEAFARGAAAGYGAAMGGAQPS